MVITIQLKALSVNNAWRGRRFKTDDYKQYEADCFKLIKGEKVEGWVEIKYRFYLKNFGNTDVSNLVKLLEDIIVKCELIDDDRKVVEFSAKKIKSKEDKIEIELLPYKL